MEAEKLQNNTELADRKATAEAILKRMHEEKSRHENEEKGGFEGGGTLGEIGSLKELQSKEKISVRENGQEAREEVNEYEQKNKEKPLGQNGQEDLSTQLDEGENKAEKLGNISEIIGVGDVVLPLWESDEAFEKEDFWFLEEVIKEDDGEEILRLVLKDKDGNKLVYRDENGEKINQSSFGRSWEQITPRYEDAGSYISKLKVIREALEKARDEGDEYRTDKLGDLLKQVRHFALNFKDKVNS